MPLNPKRSPGTMAGSGHTNEELRAVAAQWFARRDAGMTAAQEREFQRWLEADPRHGDAFAMLDSAWTTFGLPVRAGVADELLQELATRATRRRRRRGRGITAAALMGLLVVGVFWSSHRTMPPPTAVVFVPDRQTLPDGSVVELKDDAKIEVDFSSAARRVTLRQGEAMFVVAKQSEWPFVVSAGGIEVQAVGTAFSVQLGSGQVGILVTEGRVALAKTDETSKPGPGQAPSSPALSQPLAILDAGKHCVLETTPAAEPQVVAMAPKELDERLAWRSPRLEFSGSPLAEAVALLNRHASGPSAVQLELADASLATMRVSGIFRADNTDTFVMLLEAGLGIKAERLGDKIVLRRAP